MTLKLFPKLLLALFMMTGLAKAELIVLASPPNHLDEYYTRFIDDIVDFQVAYARQIRHSGDQVLILSNRDLYDYYVSQLGADAVLLAPQSDIWMRDFTVLNTAAPVMFRYSAEGQGGNQLDADDVQEDFALLLEKAGLAIPETDLINDGGNYVDDFAGRAVLSRKFLRDNRLSEAEAREKISALTGIRHMAFIEADEQGGLEHADGVVSFIDENTLIINSYPQDPAYAKDLKADLRKALPGVRIHEIITPYDGKETVDARFGSACGLYTNALVTPERIYFPQFGIPEDKIALKQIRAITSKNVIPVRSHHVCPMGGGVRCMSLQLRGEAARRLLDYARRP